LKRAFRTGPNAPLLGLTIALLSLCFACADGSGTFDIDMNVKLENATGNTTANWNVAGGTGVYANLKDNGSLVCTAIVQGTSILDVYDGQVH
jgi:hypothetical protein